MFKNLYRAFAVLCSTMLAYSVASAPGLNIAWWNDSWTPDRVDIIVYAFLISSIHFFELYRKN